MTKMRNYKFFLLLTMLVFASIGTFAQQITVDSIVAVLGKIDVSKPVDTTAFTKLMAVIENTPLNDVAVSRLESAADKLRYGTNEYWRYMVKFSIMNSLIVTDKKKSIDYGEKNFEEALTSKTPHANFIAMVFLKQERIPYRNSNMLPEGMQRFTQKLKAYKLSNDSSGLCTCYYVLGGFYRTLGLVDQSIYNMKKSVSYMHSNENIDTTSLPFYDPLGRNFYYNNIAVIAYYYIQKQEYNQALQYAYIVFNELNKNPEPSIGNVSTYIAQCKMMLGQMDSVPYFLNYTFNYKGNLDKPDYIAFATQTKALYKIKTGDLNEAEILIKQCWQLIDKNKIPVFARPGIINPDYYLALLRIQQNKLNDAINLLIKDIQWLNGVRLETLRDYKMMANLYEQTGNYKQATQTWQVYNNLQDSLQADQSKYGTINFETEQEINAKELSITKLQSESKVSAIVRNFLIGIAVLVLLLAVVIYYRFKTKQKDNKILHRTLSELKSTQSQLIQSEKMASLGELTAGIAHEIQNPLNFVNNFSEVNKELLVEMKEEMNKGNLDDAKEIANGVIENSEKINHHGKRAGDIVKGMLQHSQKSTGVKEPTDINALADEYLRLSYHGLRAKDKIFNATMKTDFDESIGKINIIPQDIGRVLLNLYNNAFYACTERSRSAVNEHPSTGSGGQIYEPTVSVTTKKSGNSVIITVSDNGNGIPEKVKDKIFQPFFTTKPTGQGTGLGLSLSYDIVKAHGGEINVESKEGEGTKFIVTIPA